MTSSVRAAFRAWGGRNAVTPFEIDSTPVTAAEPDAKALSRTKTVSVPVPAASGCGTSACGHAPAVHLASPTEIMARREPMNAYVGRAKRRPDSRTPRRLPRVSTAMQESDRATSWELRAGAADVIAKTPAATETETVST